jgi:hypothetical protein
LALDLVEHDDARRGAAQLAEHLARGALQSVEAVAIAQVATDDVRNAIEMLREAPLPRQTRVL